MEPSARADRQAALARRAPRPEALEKVSEILFGAQSCEYQRRLELLGKRLRAHLRAEIDAIERRFETDIEEIRGRLESEAFEREVGNCELTRRIQGLSHNLGKLLGEVEQKLPGLHDGPRQEMGHCAAPSGAEASTGDIESRPEAPSSVKSGSRAADSCESSESISRSTR